MTKNLHLIQQFIFNTQTKTTSHASKIITTLTQFLLEPIKAYKSKHNTESQKSSLLLEPIELQSECNENLLEDIAKTLALHKKRAEVSLIISRAKLNINKYLLFSCVTKEMSYHSWFWLASLCHMVVPIRSSHQVYYGGGTH